MLVNYPNTTDIEIIPQCPMVLPEATLCPDARIAVMPDLPDHEPQHEPRKVYMPSPAVVSFSYPLALSDKFKPSILSSYFEHF